MGLLAVLAAVWHIIWVPIKLLFAPALYNREIVRVTNQTLSAFALGYGCAISLHYLRPF